MSLVTTPVQDISKGLDLTTRATVEASEVNQAVDAAYPSTDKGLVITTTDVAGDPQVPDADTVTKWKGYVWRRITSTETLLYYWDESQASDASYLQWILTTDKIRSYIADMDALKAVNVENVADGHIAFLSGYRSAADLGGGLFVWDSTSTTADDGGGIIRPDSVLTDDDPGRWIRLAEGAVNPYMFGAYGNNANDDTDALQACLDFAVSNGTRMVFIPSATGGVNDAGGTLRSGFKITERLIVNGVTLYGSRPDQAQIWQHADDHIVVTINFHGWLVGGIYSLAGRYYNSEGTQLDWDHSFKISGVGLRFMEYNENEKCCIGVYDPGEAAVIENCYLTKGYYNVWTVGIGAPGLYCQNVMAHAPYKAAFYHTSYIPDTPKHCVARYEGCSCDVPKGAHVFLFDDAIPQVSIRNLKVEDSCYQGMIRVNLGAIADDDTNYFLSYLNVSNLNVNSGDAGALDATEIEESAIFYFDVKDSAQHADVKNGIKFTLQNSRLVNLRYLVYDNYIRNEETSEPFKLPIAQYSGYVTGYTQTQQDVAIAYIARRWGTTGSNRQRTERTFYKGATAFSIIPTMTTEGWYRIATNSDGNILGNEFTLKTGSNKLRFKAKVPQYGAAGVDVKVLEWNNGSAFKAIKVGWYKDSEVATWTNGFVDVWIDPASLADIPPNAINKALTVSTNATQAQRTWFEISTPLIQPFLVSTDVLDSQLNYAAEYIDIPAASYDLHAKYGHTSPHLLANGVHLWLDDDNNFRVLDSKARVEFFDSTGSGAEAVAEIRDYAVKSVRVLNGGSGYSANAIARIVPKPGSQGSGAELSLTISAGVITAVTVGAEGSLYNYYPTNNNAGKRITLEDEGINGTPVVNARMLKSTLKYDLAVTTNSSIVSRPATTTPFRQIFGNGDVLLDGTTIYYIKRVLSDDYLELHTAYAGVTSPTKSIDKIGIGLYWPEDGYYGSFTDLIFTNTQTTPIEWLAPIYLNARVLTDQYVLATELIDPLSLSAANMSLAKIAVTIDPSLGAYLSPNYKIVVFTAQLDKTPVVSVQGSPIKATLVGTQHKETLVN